MLNNWPIYSFAPRMPKTQSLLPRKRRMENSGHAKSCAAVAKATKKGGVQVRRFETRPQCDSAGARPKVALLLAKVEDPLAAHA